MVRRLFKIKRMGLVFSAVLAIFLVFPALSAAWTPGLKEAADAFAQGTATFTQEMMIFVHNAEVNLLAQEGKISMSTYRNCQEEFFKLNDGFVHKAVHDAGFEPSISSRKYNPGTDTDVNILSKGSKKITLDDVKKIEGNYQKNVREYFESKGAKPPAGKVQTETDFMAHPQYTDPDEFQKIIGHINQGGGTAYTDPRAALAQSKLGTTRPMTFDEASSFSSTMKDFAEMKIGKANGLRKEASAIRGSNPGRAEYLEAKARQFDYQAAKYHNRIDAANNHLRRQHGLPENPRNITGFQQSADIIELSGRNPFTGRDASTIHNLHKSALQSSTDDMIDTLVEIAKQRPSRAAEIQRALGREINSLPPNRAGQAIERIESATKGVKKLDGSLARGAVAEAKMLKQAATASSKWTAYKERVKDLTGYNRMTKFGVVMTVGGALLTAHTGVSVALDNVQATDTVWDFFRNCYYHAAWEGTGIGPAFEQSQREEIERYMKEFEAGHDPSMVKHVAFTILKTGVYMGKECVIGVLYLPDTVWEYFTQEKEMEAYAAMQNELARAMRQMILDRKDFEQVMLNMKKMGLYDSDAKDFLNCLCRGCGGSLGGFYNPGFRGEYGHGPCQCNGPLTIWNTPLPVKDMDAQRECFNTVAKMRYNEAQAIFDKWRKQAIEENAKSVEKELKLIKTGIANGTLRDEQGTLKMVNEFAAIKELLRPEDVDGAQAMLGPSLTNFAEAQVRKGNVDRGIDYLDRALNKLGSRNLGNEEGFRKSRKAQFEKWATAWKEAKEKHFSLIDDLVRKKRIRQAHSEIGNLEYKMLKIHTLPPATEDPSFVALKERVERVNQEYPKAALAMQDKIKAAGLDHKSLIDPLQKYLDEWEHTPENRTQWEKRLASYKDMVERAGQTKTLGEEREKAGDLPGAIAAYGRSLGLQKDDSLARRLDELKKQHQIQTEKAEKARLIWIQARRLTDEKKYPEAISKYKEGLALSPNKTAESELATVEWLLKQQKEREAAAAKKAEEAKKAEAEKKAAEAKKAEEAKRAEAEKKAVEAKKAEEAKRAEAEKKAAEAKKAEEAKQVAAVSGAKYLGCFKDTGTRDLSGHNFQSGQMSTDMCLQTCRDKGFGYAGTQYSSWCFCGDTYGKYGPASNCGMKCSGNAGETCGGTWANSIYQLAKTTVAQQKEQQAAEAQKAEEAKRAEAEKKATEAKKAEEVKKAEAEKKAVEAKRTVVSGAKYLGCFKDTGTRDLSGHNFQSGQMSTDMCLQTCRDKGFGYAGTQYSSWCFCGDTYGKYGPASNCGMKCSGNAGETCGGAWANSIYQLAKTTAAQQRVEAEREALATIKRTGYLGCFKDTGTRDLSGHNFQSGQMSTDMCLQTCRDKGFGYAGTQYSSQCFCGDAYGKYGPASNCDMKCSGKPDEICGGTWANSIYQLAKTTAAQQRVEAEREALATIKRTGYLGCFKDTGTRDLSGHNFQSGQMSTDMCLQTCRDKGFGYAGTQYSSWCFCGDTYGKYGPASNCDMKCSGKADETCGGTWANSIYLLAKTAVEQKKAQQAGEVKKAEEAKRTTETQKATGSSSAVRSTPVAATPVKPVSASANGASLHLNASVVEPNAPFTVRWTAGPDLPGNAWLGLMPAATPHGKASVNGQHHVAHEFLQKKTSGEHTFTAPSKEGRYDVRISDPSKDQELVSVTFTVQVNQAAGSLSLPRKTYAPNEPITVSFTASAGYPGNAWVGLIPSATPHGKTSVNDQHDMAYVLLQKKTSGELSFTAPTKEGNYDLRMSETTNDKEIASVTFTVAVPTEGVRLTLPKSRYAPNEKITVVFSAPATLPGNAWVGLIPSATPHGKTSVNDQHDMAYVYLQKKTSGEMSFTAPTKEGNYDLRMSETTNDKEIASVTFTVAVPTEGIRLALPKSRYAPNEKITVAFSAPATLPGNAWVGLIPSATPHGKTSVNDQHDMAYVYLQKKTSGEMSFTAPAKEGNYDLRMSETTNDKELLSLSFQVVKDASSTGQPVTATTPPEPPNPSVDSSSASGIQNSQSGGQGVTRVETLPEERGGTSSREDVDSGGKRWVNAADPNHFVQRMTTPQGVRWVEHGGGKPVFYFEEKEGSHAGDTVMLFDSSRGMSATLYPDRFEYGVGGRVYGTYRGGWK